VNKLLIYILLISSSFAQIIEKQIAVSKKTARELRSQIEVITDAINTSLPGEERESLYYQRAQNYYLLAQKKLLNSKKINYSKEEKKLFRKAEYDLLFVNDSIYAKKEIKAKSNYTLGLIYSNLIKEDQAYVAFKESVELDPISGESAWIRLYLAEYNFNKDNYLEALRYYKAAQNGLNKDELELALFKSGWCYRKLSKYKLAQEVFLQHLNEYPNGSFRKDVIRDLASTLVKKNKAEVIIDIMKMNLEKNSEKKFFLSQVNQFYNQEKKLEDKKIILDELYKLEKNPFQSLVLRLENLKEISKLKNDKLYYKSYLSFVSFMQRNKLDKNKKSRLKINKDFEAILSELLNIEILNHKKNKKSSSKKIKVLIEDYRRYFKGKVLWTKNQELLFDLCWYEKDWACVVKATGRILSNTTLKAKHQDYHWKKITSLEKLYEVKKIKAALLIKELDYFSKKYPKSSHWRKIKLRLFALLDDKRYANVKERILRDVFDKENKLQDLVSLQKYRFKIKKYEELVNHKLSKVRGAAKNPLLKRLKQDSILKLALGAQENSNTKNFNKYISLYEKNSDDPKKLLQVKHDWLLYFYKKKNWQKLKEAFQSLKANSLSNKSIKALYERIVDDALYAGNFNRAYSFLSVFPETALDESKIYIKRMSELVIKPQNLITRSKKLANNQKIVLFNLLMLRDPAAVKKYFLSKKQSLNRVERFLLLWSSRFVENNWFLAFDQKLKNILAEMAPAEWRKKTHIGVVDDYKKLLWPLSSDNEQSWNSKIETLVKNIRLLRKKLLSQIVDKAPSQQYELYSIAELSERRLAETILRSPAPKDFKAGQITAYKKGLASVAAEFQKQAVEFTKLKNSSKKNIKKLKQEALTLASPSLKKWPWPKFFMDKNNSQAKVLRNLIKQKQSYGALVLLELIRAKKDNPLAKLEDYYSLRGGLLLNFKKNRVMLKFTQEELRFASQFNILSKWAKIVK